MSWHMGGAMGASHISSISIYCDLFLLMIQHLGFLYPLKRIQSDLMVKLKQDSSAASIYKWIKVWGIYMYVL